MILRKSNQSPLSNQSGGTESPLSNQSPRKGGKGPAKGPGSAAAPAEPGAHRFDVMLGHPIFK
jgi:hypothetical protein